jgi:hypothetical protein
MRSGKLVIAVGGGPTAVINQSLAGAVLEARLFSQIERIMARATGCAASSTRILSTFRPKVGPISKRSPRPCDRASRFGLLLIPTS